VSVRDACLALEVRERRVRQLVRSGLLVRLRHRITAASLQREVDRRRIPAIEPTFEGIRKDSLPGICEKGLSIGEEPVHAQNVMTTELQAQLHGLRLLGIPRAASVLGRSEAATRELVRSGRLPSVEVGARRLVSIETLQRFVRGSGK
jgi:excisionase family DNA binding protein